MEWPAAPGALASMARRRNEEGSSKATVRAREGGAALLVVKLGSDRCGVVRARGVGGERGREGDTHTQRRRECCAPAVRTMR